MEAGPYRKSTVKGSSEIVPWLSVGMKSAYFELTVCTVFLTVTFWNG